MAGVDSVHEDGVMTHSAIVKQYVHLISNKYSLIDILYS
jgi:hypothetical protein